MVGSGGMADYSREALLDFLHYAEEKGLMNKNTAAARRAAVSNMLSVLDSSEDEDVRSLDLDEVTKRFSNKYKKKYTPTSLRVYRSRLRTSIDEFVRFTDSPASFRAAPGVKPNKKAPRPAGDAQPANLPVPISAVAMADAPASAYQTVNVPIPLRSSCVVTINGIPLDLTEREAQRIANVIIALASGNSE